MKYLLNSKMKFSSGLFALILMTSVNAEMNQKNGRPHRPKINHEQVVQQLNLNESITQSLLKLMNEHRSKHQAQRNMNREKHREMRKQHGEEVKSLLGEEKFSSFRKIMRQLHQQKRKNRPIKGVGVELKGSE